MGLEVRRRARGGEEGESAEGKWGAHLDLTIKRDITMPKRNLQANHSVVALSADEEGVVVPVDGGVVDGEELCAGLCC